MVTPLALAYMHRMYEKSQQHVAAGSVLKEIARQVRVFVACNLHLHRLTLYYKSYNVQALRTGSRGY